MSYVDNGDGGNPPRQLTRAYPLGKESYSAHKGSLRKSKRADQITTVRTAPKQAHLSTSTVLLHASLRPGAPFYARLALLLQQKTQEAAHVIRCASLMCSGRSMSISCISGMTFVVALEPSCSVREVQEDICLLLA